MIKKCHQCRSDFKTYSSTAKFCSRKCYTAHRHRGKSGNKKCNECGKIFYVPKCRDAAIYCSLKCKYKAGKRRIRKSSICINCGKNFSYNSNLFGVHFRQYCSTKCLSKIHGSKIKTFSCVKCGKKFKAEKRKRRKYCSDECRYAEKRQFIKEYRDTTLKRKFKNRGLIKQCEHCGLNDPIEILGIHHKDFNGGNNSFKNLIVLCPNCHSIEHLRHITH